MYLHVLTWINVTSQCLILFVNCYFLVDLSYARKIETDLSVVSENQFKISKYIVLVSTCFFLNKAPCQLSQEKMKSRSPDCNQEKQRSRHMNSMDVKTI